VTTELDLNQFTVFNRYTTKCRGEKGRWFSVNVRNEVCFSQEIGRNYEPGDTIEFLLNKKGTILVVRKSGDGLPLIKSGGKKQSKRVTCKSLRETLGQLGIKIPVRFWAEWNEELQAWIGRR
jgi:hypothetical protein